MALRRHVADVIEGNYSLGQSWLEVFGLMEVIPDSDIGLQQILIYFR